MGGIGAAHLVLRDIPENGVNILWRLCTRSYCVVCWGKPWSMQVNEISWVWLIALLGNWLKWTKLGMTKIWPLTYILLTHNSIRTKLDIKSWNLTQINNTLNLAALFYAQFSDVTAPHEFCCSQTVYFDWCIIPRTTVCKHTRVYDVTLLQHSIPPTWRE